MIKSELARVILKVVENLRDELGLRDLPPIILERPKEKAHGDWSTNLAFLLSSQVKLTPQEIATKLVSYLRKELNQVDKIEVAGGGFINFFLKPVSFLPFLPQIIKKGGRYGEINIGQGIKTQVEFVSANPVGPMHIGHGRWAAVGDSLANILEKAGFRVEREFYINDYGSQMDIFAKSVSARYSEILGEKVTFPENGYQGAYIYEIAQEIVDKDGKKFLQVDPIKREQIFKERAYKQVLEHIRKTLEKMGVIFDVWFSERTLHKKGKVKETVNYLKANGCVYEKDGAVWLRTSQFGDDKDRVLIRENGEPTYFASDIAYHKDKYERGFQKVIDIWGADHHGYVKRMKAAMKALRYSDDFLEVIIGQMVNLLRGKDPVRMSKRTGEMVTLEEILDEVGKDALRYFFVSKNTDSALDFDIELAKKESQENPVYYVQYAHARICSILKFAEERGIKQPSLSQVNLSLLRKGEELDLIKKLVEFPEIIEECALSRAPYKLTIYAQDLAALFHIFYTQCRVVSEDECLTKARLLLVKATQTVLKEVLRLLGVSAPEKM